MTDGTQNDNDESNDALEWARANRDRIREWADSDEPIADLCRRLDANLDQQAAGDDVGSVLNAPPPAWQLRAWATEVREALDGGG